MVSVCIPAYGHAGEVRRLLETLAEQDYPRMEINISDDSEGREVEEALCALASMQPVGGGENAFASKPGDVEETASAACPGDAEETASAASPGDAETILNGTLPRRNAAPLFVRYVRNRKKKGHVLNWNAAIRMADKEAAYLKIFFSDDYCTGPDTIRSFVELLEETPEAALAFSGSRQVLLHDDAPAAEQTDYTDRHAEEKFVRALAEDYRELFLGNQIGAPSATMIRTGRLCHAQENPVDPDHRKNVAASRFLFDEESGFASDVFLYMDVLKDYPRFAWTRRPLVAIGLHDAQYTEGFSEKDERIYVDYRLLYDKHRLWEKASCRAYMLRHLILPYRKGWTEAKACRIPWREYAMAFVRYKNPF